MQVYQTNSVANSAYQQVVKLSPLLFVAYF
ncbi:hypothetical protein N561_04625 [Gallibacterium anatis 12656/12]|uniref:Uncharacterized protein n=1 Tax=Gallibacterium anatis 12656/12 TaxID=1195244 RepID=U1I921_9PAST|nr:hypothetical protein N561_04625 [Gallibacterium anatis 12656/12]